MRHQILNRMQNLKETWSVDIVAISSSFYDNIQQMEQMKFTGDGKADAWMMY